MKRIKFNLRKLVVIWQVEHNDNLSLSKLSKVTGIRLNTLMNYRDGTFKSIPVDNLLKLIEFFGCELSDLLKYEEE